MRINSKLLAGLAVFVLLLGVSSQLANHAFAYTSTDKYAHAKAVAEKEAQEALKEIKQYGQPATEKVKPSPNDFVN